MRQRESRATSFVAPSNRIQHPKHVVKEQKKRITAQVSDHFFSSKMVFALCLVFRLANSLLVQTYFNPDEHWQALEVAHHITFGYGHLTWEWNKGIRSYLHPMLFAVLYKILAIFHLDTPWFMMKAPRLVQSVFSAVGDFYFYKFSVAVFGDQVARLALFCQLTNWFMFFSFTRTLSNSLETVLTLVSLYYWPCMRVSSKKEVSRRWGLVVAALACAIRPTSAITWVYVGLLELFLARDRLRFIIFEGFPVMVFTFLPFTVVGIFLSKQWKLSGLIAWVLGLYSVLGHKEFRFVLPVLPIALMFAGYSLAMMKKTDSSESKRKGSLNIRAKFPSKRQLTIVFLLASNVPMALYMSLIHQRGTEDVMNYLSVEALNGKVKSILFLMPCHATPYYSTLHRDLPMHFLDCTPSAEKGTIDESDRFMMDPVGFTSNFVKNWSPPSHIVLFDSEERQLRELLILHSFKEIKRFFHAHFKVDHGLQASVAVYALTGNPRNQA
ncbi:mannosyltransferase APTG1 isoform X2 [Malania oleifera]|uniref:mannosyltransferase APTG1 isoform X2 n=1 Tax=Malania oleifera TaxID=397392 RepID=UPI0025AE5073|nr:mannosyltransferase APTG1 isoform X2 [Malania oleifera]